MEQRQAVGEHKALRRRGVIVGAAVLALLTSAGVAAADVVRPGYMLWGMDARTGRTSARAVMSLDSASDQLLARSVTDRLAVATHDALVLENADGSDRVLVPSRGQPGSASFSPSGAILTFTTATCPDGNPQCSKLYVVNSDGSNQHFIASDTSAASWSPDGRSVVYVGGIGWSGSAAFGRLTVQSLTGRAPQILGPAYPGLPVFSPNGRRIAYDCPDGGVCVLNLQNKHLTNLRAVTKLPVTASPYVLWSPDSRRIAVNTAADFDLGLVVVNLQSNATQVLSGVYWLDEVAAPLAWSPDSRTLLWGYRFNKVRIFETNVVTRHRTRVSRNDRLWYLARWTHKEITFLTYTGTYQPTY
jgi:Tol biopolymer transport system component